MVFASGLQSGVSQVVGLFVRPVRDEPPAAADAAAGLPLFPVRIHHRQAGDQGQGDPGLDAGQHPSVARFPAGLHREERRNFGQRGGVSPSHLPHMYHHAGKH